MSEGGLDHRLQLVAASALGAAAATLFFWRASPAPVTERAAVAGPAAASHPLRGLEHRIGMTPHSVSASCSLPKKAVKRLLAAAGVTCAWDSPISAGEFERVMRACSLAEGAASAGARPVARPQDFTTARRLAGEGPRREIVCQRVEDWLADQPATLGPSTSVITSFPDRTETPYTQAEWTQHHTVSPSG